MIDLFFPSMLRRWPFFWRSLFLGLMGLLLMGDIYARGLKITSSVPVVILCIYEVFFLFLPRMRDGNISRWLLLLILIPFGDKALSIILGECKNVSVNWKSATSFKEPPLGVTERGEA
jgi:uncharacterized membrane protein YhaH (DUF805 family)